MSTTPTPLKPCPFCGGGETILHVNKGTWNGQRYGEPVSVEVRHWCEPVDGQPGRMLDRVGRDEASAIAAWNRRAALTQGAGEAVEPVAIPPGFKGHGPLLDALLEAAFHVSRDGANTFDAVMFQDALHKVKEGLPAQQAVARAVEVCDSRAQMHSQNNDHSAANEAKKCAAAIRAKGTHDQ